MEWTTRIDAIVWVRVYIPYDDVVAVYMNMPVDGNNDDDDGANGVHRRRCRILSSRVEGCGECVIFLVNRTTLLTHTRYNPQATETNVSHHVKSTREHHAHAKERSSTTKFVVGIEWLYGLSPVGLLGSVRPSHKEPES